MPVCTQYAKIKSAAKVQQKNDIRKRARIFFTFYPKIPSKICVYQKIFVPLPQIIVEQSDMPLEENISSSSARRDSAEDISSFPASRDSAKNISSFPASRDSAKVPCLAPIKHNKQRRKKDHDYTAISLYLITVTTTNRQRLLGTLLGNSAEAATIEATDIGKMVIACFKRIPEITKQKTGCRVQVVQYQLMPDHFHGILYVQDELPKEWPLGQIISGWKGACTRAYNALISSFPARRDSAE